jgi:hypothetical protein
MKMKMNSDLYFGQFRPEEREFRFRWPVLARFEWRLMGVKTKKQKSSETGTCQHRHTATCRVKMAFGAHLAFPYGS